MLILASVGLKEPSVSLRVADRDVRGAVRNRQRWRRASGFPAQLFDLLLVVRGDLARSARASISAEAASAHPAIAAATAVAAVPATLGPMLLLTGGSRFGAALPRVVTQITIECPGAGEVRFVAGTRLSLAKRRRPHEPHCEHRTQSLSPHW